MAQARMNWISNETGTYLWRFANYQTTKGAQKQVKWRRYEWDNERWKGETKLKNSK